MPLWMQKSVGKGFVGDPAQESEEFVRTITKPESRTVKYIQRIVQIRRLLVVYSHLLMQYRLYVPRLDLPQGR